MLVGDYAFDFVFIGCRLRILMAFEIERNCL